MRKQSIILSLLLLCTLLLPLEQASGDTVIHQEMIDQWGKRSGSVLSYSKKRLRIDQKDGMLSTILDFNRDRIFILEHTSKSYVSYALSTWEKEVSRQIANPKGHQKRDIRVEPTGAEREINGFQTLQIQIFIEDTLFKDLWVTRDVDVGDMLETVEERVTRLEGLSKAEIEENQEIYVKIKKWGFPILTTEYRSFGGKILEELTEVTHIEDQELPSHLFRVPKGYRKRTP
jgi:hypothetical protein